jgi:hypothetical protein
MLSVSILEAGQLLDSEQNKNTKFKLLKWKSSTHATNIKQFLKEILHKNLKDLLR